MRETQPRNNQERSKLSLKIKSAIAALLVGLSFIGIRSANKNHNNENQQPDPINENLNGIEALRLEPTRKFYLRSGDNLTRVAQEIANRTNYDFNDIVTRLVELNAIRIKSGVIDFLPPNGKNFIQIGQEVIIPAPEGLPSNEELGSTNPNAEAPKVLITYTVRPGDTLSRIAEIYDVTVEDIAAQNIIKDPNKIGEGDILTILVPQNLDLNPQQ